MGHIAMSIPPLTIVMHEERIHRGPMQRSQSVLSPTSLYCAVWSQLPVPLPCAVWSQSAPCPTSLSCMESANTLSHFPVLYGVSRLPVPLPCPVWSQPMPCPTSLSCMESVSSLSHFPVLYGVSQHLSHFPVLYGVSYSQCHSVSS